GGCYSAHPYSAERTADCFRTYRGKAGGGAPAPYPPADRQPAAAPSEVASGLDRLSGLVSRPRPECPDPVCHPPVLNGDALLAVSQLCTTRSNSSGRSFGT